MLLIFYKYVVESALVSSIICWGSSISARCLGRWAGVNTVTVLSVRMETVLEPLETFGVRRILHQMKNLPENSEYPLHQKTKLLQSVVYVNNVPLWQLKVN